MVFKGNPGTGKTTVARIIADILRGLGILQKGQLIETDRGGLVAEYAGQTAVKTGKRIDEAVDGILFIDEAYSLVDSGGDDAFGREALQTLLKRMEDDRERLVVIFAGYPNSIDELLQSNPGLTSRVGLHFTFDDYSPDQLLSVFQLLCKEHQYQCLRPTRDAVHKMLTKLHEERNEHFGNGRVVRNIFEKSIRRMASRIAPIAPLTHELLTQIMPQDLEAPSQPTA
jgi:SpoVK/Ycf46/Vps4 family AAA+-type ATPase